MTKLALALLTMVLVAAIFSMPAFPRGNGGRGAPSHGANATPSGSPAPNAKALENSNGQFIDERKFGPDRAALRKGPRTRTPVPPPLEELTKVPR